MTYELEINGKDASQEWGLRLDETALSILMTPPPQKELITNQSRFQHGIRQTGTAKTDSRIFTILINISAESKTDFFLKYESFCEELKGGTLHIRTKYQPSILYRCKYQSCTQFSQWNREMGQFALKLIEQNPEDREL